MLVAIGSEPIVPDIPGIDGKNVTCAPYVYGDEDSLSEKFHNVGKRLYMIGDCDKAGNVQKVMRSAFATASML